METTESWNRAHWIVGIATLVTFNLTGAYMRWGHDPPDDLLFDDDEHIHARAVGELRHGRIRPRQDLEDGQAR